MRCCAGWALGLGPSGRARRRVPINQSQMARQAGWRWLGGVYQEARRRWRANEKEAELGGMWRADKGRATVGPPVGVGAGGDHGRSGCWLGDEPPTALAPCAPVQRWWAALGGLGGLGTLPVVPYGAPAAHSTTGTTLQTARRRHRITGSRRPDAQRPRRALFACSPSRAGLGGSGWPQTKPLPALPSGIVMLRMSRAETLVIKRMLGPRLGYLALGD